ncbi:hypothetical protein E2C01_002592 [Portunus trituberculatus]|uniref:Uncharacterized protein n=1 Tax=Portunus trituberculatus TaxID=210409 RepID=A0A5B7CMF2_PORTR|nr:hypothetical protein [Portunus trituberculatus]
MKVQYWKVIILQSPPGSLVSSSKEDNMAAGCRKKGPASRELVADAHRRNIITNSAQPAPKG